MTFWEKDAEEMIGEIKKDFGSTKNLLYVISAGPMSGPIIAELFKYNPDNCYIDFGSAIDEFYRDKITRPYMVPGNEYADRNCFMDDPYTADFAVSVVLNLYKRPETLALQLDAVSSQSLRPKEILLFQDRVEGQDIIYLPDCLKEKFCTIKISGTNAGVWGRFKFAMANAVCKYVCVFDDDTIPGKRWLENCHVHMLRQPGLFGTNGIVLKHPEEYAYKGFFRIGWFKPLNHLAEVDFVGHAWFCQTEWLKFLFTGTEDLQKLKTAGEDMAFSAQLQKQGIYTFVPPHYIDNKDFWGSLPEYALKFGLRSALSTSSENFPKMNYAMRLLLQRGFKPLRERNYGYWRKLRLQYFFRPRIKGLRRFLANLLCCFILLPALRRKIRAKLIRQY